MEIKDNRNAMHTHRNRKHIIIAERSVPKFFLLTFRFFAQFIRQVNQLLAYLVAQRTKIDGLL